MMKDAANGLLLECASVLVILVMDCSLAVCAFGYLSEGIVERYYTAALRAEAPADFRWHVVMVVVAASVRLLTFCLAATAGLAVLHLLLSDASISNLITAPLRSVGLVLCSGRRKQRDDDRPDADAITRSQLFFQHRDDDAPGLGRRASVSGSATSRKRCRVNLPWLRMCGAVVGAAALGFSLAEAYLLFDMGVHVLDAELLAVAGVSIVVRRRFTLGLGLAPHVLPLVFGGALGLLAFQSGLVLASKRLLAMCRHRSVKGIVACVVLLWLALSTLWGCRGKILQEKVQLFTQV